MPPVLYKRSVSCLSALPLGAGRWLRWAGPGWTGLALGKVHIKLLSQTGLDLFAPSPNRPCASDCPSLSMVGRARAVYSGRSSLFPSSIPKRKLRVGPEAHLSVFPSVPPPPARAPARGRKRAHKKVPSAARREKRGHRGVDRGAVQNRKEAQEGRESL
ncbi:unnamed protein product [Calypogeia fissa]